jgi:hypothetical protein
VGIEISGFSEITVLSLDDKGLVSSVFSLFEGAHI